MFQETEIEFNYKYFIEKFPDSLLVLDHSGFIEHSIIKNFELNEILKKKGKSIKLFQILPDFEASKLRKGIANVISSGVDTSFKSFVNYNSQNYHYEFRLSLINHNNIFVVVRDINEEKNLEHELKVKERILEIGTRISEIMLMSDDLKYNATKIVPMLGRTLSSDRAFLLINSSLESNYKTFSLLAEWSDEEILPAFSTENIFELDMGYYFPEAMIMLEKGVPYEKNSDELNTTAQRLMQSFQVQSLLFIPIIIKQELVALIHLHEVVQKKRRTSSEISVLKVIAELLAFSIARKKQIQQLKLSEEKFKLVFERSYDGIIITDSKGRITDWNVGMDRIFMLKKDQMKGVYMWDFIFNHLTDEEKSFDRLAELKEIITEFLITGGLNSGFYDFQTKIVTFDGNIKIIQAINTPVETETGNMICSIIRDITSQKEAESKLADNLRFFETLIEVIPNPVFYKDVKTGKYLGCNKAFEDLYGLPKNELIGKTAYDVYGSRNYQEVIEQDHYVAESKSVQKFDFDFYRDDNKINNLIIYKSCYFDNHNEIAGIVGNIMDVTSIVESEKKLREYALGLELAKSTLEETVEELEKSRIEAEKANIAKTEFIAHMSHEFRTPMNAVIGFTDLLSKKVENQVFSSYLSLIKNASHTLLMLINDILDLSKIEADKLDIYKQNVDLRGMLKEISDLFTLKVIEKGITLSVEIPDNFPEIILTDEIRLKQVWLNLVGNAIKFTDTGWVQIKVNWEHSNEYVDKINLAVQIIDTGIGIPLNKQEEIFKAFMQYKPSSGKDYGGTGLGLSIVQKLIQKMNGKIYVQSEPGKGSTFFVHFYDVEIGKQNEEDSNTPEIDPNKIQFEPAKIFIIDPTENFSDLVEFYLEEQEAEVLTFNSIEQVSSNIELSKPALMFLTLNDLNTAAKNGSQLEPLNHSLLSMPKIIVQKNRTIPNEITSVDNVIGFIDETPSRKDIFEKLMNILKYTIRSDNSITQIEITSNEDELYHWVINEPESSIEEFYGLYNELEEQYDICSQYFVLGKIEHFNKILYEFGLKFNLQSVLNYSEELSTLIEIMDVKKIKEKLKFFQKFSIIKTDG